MSWGSGAVQKRARRSYCGKPSRLLRAALLATCGLVAISAGPSRAETIGGALIKAYLDQS